MTNVNYIVRSENFVKFAEALEEEHFRVEWLPWSSKLLIPLWEKMDKLVENYEKGFESKYHIPLPWKIDTEEVSADLRESTLEDLKIIASYNLPIDEDEAPIEIERSFIPDDSDIDADHCVNRVNVYPRKKFESSSTSAAEIDYKKWLDSLALAPFVIPFAPREMHYPVSFVTPQETDAEITVRNLEPEIRNLVEELK